MLVRKAEFNKSGITEGGDEGDWNKKSFDKGTTRDLARSVGQSRGDSRGIPDWNAFVTLG